MHWPAFDADLTLLPSGKLLVSGPLGAIDGSPDAGRRLRRRHAAALPSTPRRARGSAARSSSRRAERATTLPLEHGMWHFIENPTPGKLVEGPALAHALRVEMTTERLDRHHGLVAVADHPQGRRAA